MDSGELGLRVVIVVFHTFNAAQHFGKVQRLDGDALRLQDFFAITHRVECGRARADSADSKVAKSLDDPAYPGEPFQVYGKLGRVGTLRMQRREGIWNAILAKIITGRHLAAEAIATGGNGHFSRVIRRRLNQDWNPQIGQPQCVGRVTMTPSIRPRLRANNSAQRRDSSLDSTAPYLLSSGSRATTSMPAASRARKISSRPVLAKWPGKNPRLPTITAIVIFLLSADIYRFP